MTSTNLEGTFPLIARGKVRDIYQVDDNTLLFVATDRISAYDVIMANGIPNKGKILTKLSEFWFDFLPIENHLIKGDIFEKYPQLKKYRDQLEGRSLLVRKLKLIPLEVIVRGYITGSGWKEYTKSKTVHGIPIGDVVESQQITPIFTPSTKAEQGEHDENITKEQADKIVGKELCDRIEKIAIDLYTKARDYAATKGIIIADTKFEFGLDGDKIVLVDEVLTPDSSRFWSAAKYKLGQSQESYDKQFLRDWLTANGVAGKDGVAMPEDIAVQTKQKYVEAYENLTGEKWQD